MINTLQNVYYTQIFQSTVDLAISHLGVTCRLVMSLLSLLDGKCPSHFLTYAKFVTSMRTIILCKLDKS